MKNTLSLVLTVLLVLGCSVSPTGITGPKYSLKVTGDGTVAQYRCTPYTLAVVDESNAELAAPKAFDVTVTLVGAATLYETVADCTAGARAAASRATLSIPVGTTTLTRYFRSTAAGSMAIQLVTPVGTVSKAITSSAFGVLGQEDPTSHAQAAAGVGRPGQSFITGTKLLVADEQNHRVLVWNTLPTAAGTAPDLVLGQPNLDSSGGGLGVSGSTLESPVGVWSDGTRVAVADFGNNRVLVWSTFPTTNGQSADFALGQPAGPTNLTAHAANSPSVSGATMASPSGVYSDGTRLYVSDAVNNRILVWNTFPSTGGTAADFALGQANLTDYSANAGGAVGTAGLSLPRQITVAGTRLFVADSSNNRVAAWNSYTALTGGDAISFVLGQATTSASIAACAAAGMSSPQAVHSDGTRLFVGDSLNSRLLVWSAIPTVTATAADFAVGMAGGGSNLTSCSNSGTVSAVLTNGVYGVASNGTKLVVSDSLAYRLLVYNTMPVAGGPSADFALGVPAGSGNLTTSGRLVLPVTGDTMWPTDLFTDGTRMFVVDATNQRVLVWNSPPLSHGQPPDFAIGQPAGASNLLTNDIGTGGANALFGPSGVYSDGQRLFISDQYNNRVLVWNTIPSVAGVSADFAIGQAPGGANLTTNASGTTGTALYRPTHVSGDGTRLFITDHQNHRVLVWNTAPTAAGQSADFALGQPAGGSNLTSSGFGTTATTLINPVKTRVIGSRLLLVDGGNSRVLVWNTIPSVAGVSPDYVIGQSNFTSGFGVTTSSGFNSPSDVAGDGTRLFVSDGLNNRVLTWSSFPTSNVAASSVIGQGLFTTYLMNYGAAFSATSLYLPKGLFVDAGRLFIADSNHRVIVLPTY